jgi:hypothetical protein
VADTYLTLKQIGNLFWKTTTIMLGLDPDLPANANKVRLAWPTEGAPGWKITEDVVFIRIGDADDQINIIRDTVYSTLNDDNANQETAYTRVLNVHWSCYGPNAFDNAFMIRNKLYSPDIRNLLEDKQVFLIPQISSPVRAPELYNGQWWERTNVSAKFNEAIQFNNTVPYFKSATVAVTDQNNNTDILNINK